MDNPEFKKAFQKFSPEESELLQTYFRGARMILENCASQTLLSSKRRKKFDPTFVNLKYIEKYFLEESAKLKNNDPAGKKRIIKEIGELTEEIQKQSFYLDASTLDDSMQDLEQKHAPGLKRAQELIKEVEGTPPSEEEIQAILKKIEGSPKHRKNKKNR
ncbi:MAG: hypothetical protein Q8P62_02040 [Candidatus Peregrinibacteria bacterium]|nr:hypothetical protein [Candidatus Peregrinibacteria bacterium]